MENKKTIQIAKLSDTSLENVSGGKVLSPKAGDNLKTAGEVVAGVGMLGYGICKIAGSVCAAKGIAAGKYLDTAENVCKGLTALGGATYLGSKL